MLHPQDDAAYGNATSIVFYYRHGVHTILFPGDITPEGMRHLLGEKKGSEKRYTVFDRRVTADHEEWHETTSDQPALKGLLESRGLTILVAPHHGLESCYSDDLYAAIKGEKPSLVVLSERRKTREGDGKTDSRYQSEDGASGLIVEVDGEREKRRSLSTKNGHHILIHFSGAGVPGVFAAKDSERLLRKLG